MDEQALAEWFGSNTRIVTVDTAITAKDRWNVGERTRAKDRAVFLLARRLVESGMVGTTVLRGPEGDIIRVQVQLVSPAVWCENDQRIFEVPTLRAPPKREEPSPVLVGD
jgi:hypothetical protein